MTRLKRIELKDFKGVTEGAIELSGGCTVLIGPNNGGKSTWLQALELPRLFLGLPVRDPLATSDPGRYLEELTALGGSKACVRLEFEIEEETKRAVLANYRWMRRLRSYAWDELGAPEQVDDFPIRLIFEFRIDVDRRFEERLELSRIVVSDGKEFTAEISRPIAWQGGDYASLLSSAEVAYDFAVPGATAERKRETRLVKLPPSTWVAATDVDREEFPFDSYYVDELTHYATGLVFLPAHRRYQRQDDIGDAPYPVAPDGLVWLGRILHLLRNDQPRVFAELEKRVRKVLPDATELHVYTGGHPMAEMRVSEVADVDAAAAIPGWQMGAGTTHVVCMIALALRQPSESILAIEEPEAHLHPRAQRQLLEELLEISAENRFQLLLTSHGAGFLRPGDAQQAVFLVGRRHGQVQAKLINLSSTTELIEELGISPTDALFADAVLVTEGDTEKYFYEVLLRMAGSPFANRLYRIFSLEGAGGIGKALKALHTLLDERIARWLILDERGLREDVPDLPGWEIMLWKKTSDLPGEFEDQFTAEQLASALSSILPAPGVVTPDEVTDALADHSEITSRQLKRLARTHANAEFHWDGRAWGRALARSIINADDSAQWSHPTLAVFGRVGHPDWS